MNNDQIATLMSNSRQLLVVEELEPVIEEQVNTLAGTVEVFGKLTDTSNERVSSLLMRY